MYTKVVVTQGIIEVFQYEKLNVNSQGGHKDGIGQTSEENYKQTQRRRRAEVRQLICQNFDKNSKFITLTFNNDGNHDKQDVKACNKLFKEFIQRLKRRYPELQYVAVVEFQDKNNRGAVHYHMIANLPYIKKDDLSDIWGNGFIKINAIDKVDNVGAYVIKYMTVDLDDKRLQGLKAYNCSKGLKRPVELKSWNYDDKEVMEQVESLTKGKSPSYERTYESEKAGKVIYKQFNLNRKS